jgi:hypothetical protein
VNSGGAALRYWLYCCVYKLPLMVAGVPKHYDGDTDNRSAFSNNNARFNNKHNNYIKYTKSEEKEKYIINAPSGPRT